MCGFRVCVSFLLLCSLGQMGKFQATQDLEENTLVAGVAESVLAGISERMTPTNPRRTQSQSKENKLEVIDASQFLGIDSRASSPRDVDWPPGFGQEGSTFQEKQAGIKDTISDETAADVWNSLGEIQFRIKRWRTDVQPFQHPQGWIRQLIESDEKMGRIQNLASHLFTARANKLTGYSSWLKEGKFIIQEEKELLESISQIEAIWASIGRVARRSAVSILKRGYKITIDLVISLQKMEIISDEKLAHFLNKENHGQVILTYVFNAFFQSPLSYRAIFLNLNLRQSLELESPFPNKVRSLLKLLDEETWESIEFRYLTAQLKPQRRNVRFIKLFWEESKNKFLSDASEEGKKLSVEDVESFFQKMLFCLSGPDVSQQDPLELKYLYNIFCLAIRYHQETIFHFIEKGAFNSSIKKLISLLTKTERRLSEIYLHELNLLRDDANDNPYHFLISGPARYYELDLLEKKVASMNL